MQDIASRQKESKFLSQIVCVFSTNNFETLFPIITHSSHIPAHNEQSKRFTTRFENLLLFRAVVAGFERAIGGGSNDDFDNGDPVLGDFFPSGTQATWIPNTGGFTEAGDRLVFDGAAAGPTLAAQFRRYNPEGTVTTVDEIGALAVFLLSDAGAALNGSEVMADRAMSALLDVFDVRRD